MGFNIQKQVDAIAPTNVEIKEEKEKLLRDVERLENTILQRKKEADVLPVLDLKIEQLTKESNDIQVALLDAEDRLKRIKEEKSKIEVLLNSDVEAKKVLELEIEFLRKQIIELNEAIKALTESRIAEESRIKESGENSSKAALSFVALKEEVAKKNSELSQLVDKINAKNIELADKNADIISTSAGILSAQKELKELLDKIAALKYSSSIAQEEVDRKGLEIKIMEQELLNRRKQLEDEFVKKFADKEGELSFRETTLNEKADKLRGMKIEMEKHFGKKLPNIIF